MRSNSTEKRLVELPPSIAAQYETLRMAALGEPLPPEARSGLCLFLRQGMWGWAQALTVAAAPEQAGQATCPRSTAPYTNRAVIQIFAAMALNTYSRRIQ